MVTYPSQGHPTADASQSTAPPLAMDYALKRKLIEKRRELQQRARRTIAGCRGSVTKNIVASTSIFANTTSFNFSDILKAEKENQKRTRYLDNKLPDRAARPHGLGTSENAIRTGTEIVDGDVPKSGLPSPIRIPSPAAAAPAKPQLQTLEPLGERTSLDGRVVGTRATAQTQGGKRLSLDDSPEMNKMAKSKVLKDWKLSFNEASLTNYTRFGANDRSVKTTRHSLGQQPHGRLGQTFFNKRLHLQSPMTNEMERFFGGMRTAGAERVAGKTACVSPRGTAEQSRGSRRASGQGHPACSSGFSSAFSPTGGESSSAAGARDASSAAGGREANESAAGSAALPLVGPDKRVQTVEGRRLRRLQHIFGSTGHPGGLSVRMRYLISQGTSRHHHRQGHFLLPNHSVQHGKRSEGGSSVGPIDIKIQDKLTALAWQSLNEKSQSLRQSAVHHS